MNEQNLKAFPKGVSGNPKGRPKGPSRATVFRKWLNVESEGYNPDTDAKERMPLEDQIVLGLIKKARAGDAAAAKIIFDSVYGLQTQKIEAETTEVIKTVYRLADGTDIEI